MDILRNNKGGVSVEFALVLAFILVPLLVGMVDAARFVHAKVILNRAAREGAVNAMRGEAYTPHIQAVLSDAGFDTSALTVTETAPADATSDSRTIRLTYTIPDFPLFTFPGISFPDQVKADATYQRP
ncbi:TadE/TadG family type IV pilus assembly protein [Oleidesulfovibrio sp.]|uniref:TadE/TadG family type IV pilus assembly protein n=1 Tax=Oleidesulfovibrio sp. TaxID=2909707 RepID=UPI003A884633